MAGSRLTDPGAVSLEWDGGSEFLTGYWVPWKGLVWGLHLEEVSEYNRLGELSSQQFIKKKWKPT